MLRKLLLTTFVWLMATSFAFAQSGTLTGVVTDAETGETLPSVNVLIIGSQQGAATDADGNYEITNIEPGTYTVRVSFVGYQTLQEEIQIESGTNENNFLLEPDISSLDEVIVSGVAEATSRKKLTVSVDRVDASELNKVPAVSVSSSLQGKVSGVTIKNSNGTPGGQSQVQLRADNNLNISSQPLVIVDGIMLEGSMADINSDDIQSIEVVKGAAASALYGSRAGNGVIVIETKQGDTGEIGKVNVTLRNEVGIQQLENYIDLADHHAFQLADDWQSVSGYTKYGGVTYPDGYQGGYHPDVSGTRALKDDHYMDNPFNGAQDIQKEFFQNGTNYTNYFSLATRTENLNVFGSFENSSQEGIIPNTDGYDRRNFRINADYDVADWLNVSAKNLVINTESNFPGGGGGTSGNSGIFFNLVLAEPDNNLFMDNPDGQPYYVRHNHWSNETNPLYSTYKNDRTETKRRSLGSYSATANPVDWLQYDGKYSVESNNNRYTSHYPYDTWELGGNDPMGIQYSEGSLFKYSSEELSKTMQHTLTTRHQVSKLYFNVKLSYLWENREFESFESSGENFQVRGVPRFEAMNPGDISSDSWLEKVSAENYFAITSLDWNDKFLVDAMVRRDGSSLFGPNNRWNTYYRVSGAYRITEDIDLPYFTELKVRAAQGTAGMRPEFTWQYETFEVEDGSASKSTLGNKNLKPSITEEREYAINGTLFDQVNFEAIYSTSTTEDQILEVPLIPLAGYNAQWQNAGTIESESFEFNVDGTILRGSDFQWDARVTWSKSNQEITELAVPPYQDGPGGLFYMREGEEYGAIYGYTWVKTLDQMSQQLPDGASIDDYTVNSDGYVIEAGTEGTVDEAPIKMLDENGNDAFVKIGNGRPDWTAGISNTFRYKGFSAYALVDIKHGGDVYNRKSQWLTRDDRNGIMDQSGKPEDEKKAFDYYKGFYDVNTNNSYWVEDAGYVKIRELSLSYQFNQEMLSNWFGNTFQSITFSAIGRNLLTWSDYSGYDPEVGSIRTPYDGTGTYPNFRNYAFSIQMKF